MKSKILFTIFTSLLLLNPGNAYAIFDDFVDEIDVKVQSTNRFFVESDISGDSNDINVSEVRLDTEYDINPNNDVSWELDFISKNVFLDSNSSSVDLPTMLVGRAMRVGVKFPLPFIDGSDYRLGIAAVPSYYTDSWKDSFNEFESGAFRWVSEAWIDYRGSEPLSWKLGVMILPENVNSVLPLIDVRYAFNDGWSIRLLTDDFGIVYAPDERWEFFSEFRYVLDEYEISSGGIDGRVLRQKQNTTGLGVQYNFDEAAYVKATGGWGFNRSFIFQDNFDQVEVDIEDAPYFTLEFAFNF